MRTFRALWRLVAVAAVTGFYYTLVQLGALAALARPRLGVRSRDFCFRNWSRALLRVMGARVRVRGAAPELPFLLVSNHLSYVDVLVLASRVHAVFLAKSDVAGWPILGGLCRSVGTLFVDRRNRRDLPRVLAAIEQTLERGQGVVVFPEGTSTPGREVGPFHPALLAGAARAGLPVSWASLSYATSDAAAPAHEMVCWWGDMTFPAHFFDLLGLPGFTVSLVFGEERIRETDRKLLATRLRGAVAGGFTPVVASG